jgi:alpha-ketoglutarate-dependent taurine dioxygenase
LTPNIGTEIHGIQLSQLTDQQKNDLSLLVAERGVVFFRDQDINPYQGRELGNYFGPL